MLDASSRKVVIARIGAPHGVRGSVRVQPFTEDPLALEAYSPVSVATTGQVLTVKSLRPAKNMLVVDFAEVTSREAAEALRGAELVVDRDMLDDSALEEDEFFIADLVGLKVLDAAGETIGKIIHVADYGAGDVIEIKPVAEKSFLIAFSRETVPEIDLAAGHLTVHLPEELDASGSGDKGS